LNGTQSFVAVVVAVDLVVFFDFVDRDFCGVTTLRAVDSDGVPGTSAVETTDSTLTFVTDSLSPLRG
jgi:hypothetical protein